jgi:1,4-dihydroxy-2-naphthoate octaprenyltransferase
MEALRLFIRLVRPLFLLGGILMFALGVGIARYLGTTINWEAYLLGQAWVTTLQLSTQFLNEYYNAPADQENQNRTPFSGGSGALGPGKLPRRTALIAALTCLAVLASLTVLMINLKLAPSIFLLMVLAFLGAFFYSVPPVRLEASGYGELTTSILVAYLVAAFAFILQTGDLHRLLSMSTFPLVAVHMAMLIAFELPDYGNDVKYDKRTILVRLGWQKGMNLHNILILTGFLLLGIAAIFGLPRFVYIPAFFTLPLGLLQIWQIRQIANGAKPNWTAVTLGDLVLFGAMAYLITFAYWIH